MFRRGGFGDFRRPRLLACGLSLLDWPLVAVVRAREASEAPAELQKGASCAAAAAAAALSAEFSRLTEPPRLCVNSFRSPLLGVFLSFFPKPLASFAAARVAFTLASPVF